MTLLVCWIAFPLLIGLIAQGFGAVVERLAGRGLAIGVRIPCGMALLIAVMDLMTRSSATAHLTVGAVVVLAAVGLGLSPPWRWNPATPGLVAGGVVFAAYAAPVVMSGMATWTGYIKLDDTATWLALVDRALAHGHSLAGLPPSTYRATLASYLTTGYPIGSFLPLGLGHALLGEDSAWLVNPWMACLAATLTLALHRVAKLALGDRRRARTPVAIAALAGQPALLYGYYLWGGIKEMAGAALIAAFAVAAPLSLSGEHRVRAMIPAAVVLWALVAALSPGGLVWAGPGLVLALLTWGLVKRLYRPMRRGDRRRLPGSRRQWSLTLVPVIAVALGAYLVFRPGGFVERFRAGLTGSGELGNLVKPLSLQQLAGIWPTGDFRFAPAAPTVTHVLIAVVTLLAAGGLVLALRAGRHELTLYVLCALAGALLVDLLAAPWLGAKALASASPALPLAALTALAWPAGLRSLQSRRAVTLPRRMALRRSAGGRSVAAARRVVAVLAGCAVGAGIVWSNLLAYHDASLAPRAQFAELAEIGKKIAGQGPTLMTEYQPYGARHFLRDAAPEAASELRTRDDPLISGELLQPGESADIDQIQLSAVLVYRTLVLQRSPVGSRPPSPYRLIFADHFWEVWQRPDTAPRTILWHLPLGDTTHPGSVPNCPTLLRLARRAGVTRLVTEPVENPVLASLVLSVHPARWSTAGTQLAPAGAGTARLTVEVSRPGRYSVWLGGSTRGPLSVYVDRTRVGTALDEIQESGQYIPFGEITLKPGRQTVELRYGGGLWRPGVGGPPEAVGPLVLRRESSLYSEALDRDPLISLPASRAPALCGRTLDWVEGIG